MLVDIGAIALAVALGVGAWRFHPGQDARGARDRPTTTATTAPAAETPTSGTPDPATTVPASPGSTTPTTDLS
jgi:hypothetical protein